MMRFGSGKLSFFSMLQLLLLQLLATCCHAGIPTGSLGYSIIHKEESGQRRRMAEPTDDLANDSVDTGDVARILVQPFSVALRGTSEDFTASDLNALYKVMNRVVSNYIVTAKNLSNVAYILLGDIDSSSSEAGTTELYFNTGVLKVNAASINGMPDATTINTWVAEAIDQNYVRALQSTSYSFVSRAEYSANQSTDDEEAVDDTIENHDPDVSGVVDQPVTAASNSPTGVIAGTSVAAATVIGLLAMLLVQRSKRTKSDYIVQQNSKDDSTFPEQAPRDTQSIFVGAGNDEAPPSNKDSLSGLTLALSQIHQSIMSNSSGLSTSTSSTEHSGPTPAMQIVTNKPGILGAAPMVMDDSKSLDGNESDFTVNTEAGDSTAVKSLPAQTQYHPASIFTTIERETFERERQVCIRKDMMTSTWSGNTEQPRPPQNESVLEPSHLTASQARQERRSREDDMLVFEQGSHDGGPEFATAPTSQVARMARFGDVV